MSLAPLMGIPGKVKTLLDRLTSARASNLDNLNTTISSRAAASTALSTATWTNTRAGYLDASLNTINGDPAVHKWARYTANGTWTRPGDHVGNTVWTSMVGGGGGGSYGQYAYSYTHGGAGGMQMERHLVTVSGNTAYTRGGGGAKASTQGATAGTGGTTTFVASVAGGTGAKVSGQTAVVGSIGPSYTSNQDVGGAYGGYGSNFGYHTVPPFARLSTGGGHSGGGGMILGGTEYGRGGENIQGSGGTAGTAGALLLEWYELA